MPHILANLVEQTTTSRGGEITLSGPARAPYRNFADVMEVGDTTELMIVGNDRREEWQAGVYRLGANGVLTLVRFYDSPSGEPLSFGSGLKRVFISPIVSRGDWRVIDADFDALHGDRLHVIGAVTVTLPLNPGNGDVVMLSNQRGAWVSAHPTVAGNGMSIEFMGATDTSVSLADGDFVTFTFDADADLWRVA